MKQAKNTWTREELQDPHRQSDKQCRVQAMFSRIAGTYDLLNHLLSFNRDRKWRYRAIQAVRPQSGERVLDLCCGTGDMVFEFGRQQRDLARIVGLDFVSEMLKIAQQKAGKIGKRKKLPPLEWIQGNAEELPFDADTFDCVSCAFGVRNLQDIRAGFRQMHRVLKREGRIVILEFFRPEHRMLGWGYERYFRLVLPFLGSIISRDKTGAYQYLPDSVMHFQTADELKELITSIGFSEPKEIKIMQGAVRVMIAQKSDSTAPTEYQPSNPDRPGQE